MDGNNGRKYKGKDYKCIGDDNQRGKLYETIKKRKNWSGPGIDGIQNFWWKKLKEPGNH